MPRRSSLESVLPKPAPNRKPPSFVGDRVLVLGGERRGDDLVGEQRGGVLDRLLLREVHDVDRRVLGLDELLERLLQRGERPGEGQRHRPLGVVDDRGLATVAAGQVGGQLGDVAEGGRHQHELRLRQLDQRHLPGPAAVGLGIEVELVHHDQPDVGGGALAQCDVGEHLGGAADDRGVGVDRGVAGQHADVVGAEDLAQVEELLAHQRLDRRGVERHPVVGQRRLVRGDRHQRLARARRGREHDVVAGQDLEHRLVLVRVELEAARGRRRR